MLFFCVCSHLVSLLKLRVLFFRMAASSEGWGGFQITAAELIGKLLCALLSFISAV